MYAVEFLFEFIPARKSLPPTDRSGIACRTNEDRKAFSEECDGWIELMKGMIGMVDWLIKEGGEALTMYVCTRAHGPLLPEFQPRHDLWFRQIFAGYKDDLRGCKRRFKVKLVIEVGFAKNEDYLVANVRLWLDFMKSVCVVILAKYYESPSYRNPVRKSNWNRQIYSLIWCGVDGRPSGLPVT